MKIDKVLSFLDMIPIGAYLVLFESLEAMLYAQEFNSRKNLEYAFKIHEIIGKKIANKLPVFRAVFLRIFNGTPPIHMQNIKALAMRFV